MEFPDFGRHCAIPDCKRLDFLPCHCKCGKNFCSEHFQAHTETCAAFHECKEDIVNSPTKIYKCSLQTCNDTSIIPLLCKDCHKHYCVQHRHTGECMAKTAAQLAAERAQNAIPVAEFNEAKAIVDKQLEVNIEKAKKNTKSREMACKVQLMRLKNKASGPTSIPVENRVYFLVTHPKQMPEKTTAVFVSKTWSVGKAIDSIAQQCSLPNNNNKSNECKLRLFRNSDKQIVSQIMSEHLEMLLQNDSILNGDSLIIEYVDNDCIKLQ